MQRRFVLTSLLVVGVIATFALGGAFAATDEAETQTPNGPATELADTARELPVSVAGMTVFIDPETGKFRAPTAEEAAALTVALQSNFAGRQPRSFREIQLDNGGVAIDVGLSQLDFSVATIGPDGIEYDCLDSAHAAHGHVHGDAPNQAPIREER